jgi:hypothetical protein
MIRNKTGNGTNADDRAKSTRRRRRDRGVPLRLSLLLLLLMTMTDIIVHRKRGMRAVRARWQLVNGNQLKGELTSNYAHDILFRKSIEKLLLLLFK